MDDVLARRCRAADDMGVLRPPRTRGERLMRRATVAAASVLVVVLVALAFGVRFGHTEYVTPSPIGGDLAEARGHEPGLRVLFLGNSLTYENDMPGLLEQLVSSDHSNAPLYAVRYTPPGQALSQDTDNATVSGLLGEARWNYVVLQETTGVAASDPYSQPLSMDKPAQELAARIHAIGAIPLFFITWGSSSTSQFNPLHSYRAMQTLITTNYLEVATRLSDPFVPAGQAWSTALQRRPGIALWEPDGHHPSQLGAYLNAAVFYEFFYSPKRMSSFDAGLSRGDATFLQRVARATVPPIP